MHETHMFLTQTHEFMTRSHLILAEATRLCQVLGGLLAAALQIRSGWRRWRQPGPRQ